MTRVYPNATSDNLIQGSGPREPVVLTVWKKSLLFNCSGFSVFDSKGNLVFRVDNYAAGNKAEIVLMDAAGKPLHTFRKKRLSLGDHWLVYNGEELSNARLSVKKQVNLLSYSSKSLALVTGARSKHVMYSVEGSYLQRCCTMYDDKRGPVAEIQRKETVGIDVFRLVVQPELQTAVAISVVIMLEQMFG